ncbi:hypothetical protein WAI453_002729 [Rhynchosporium graminicola]
MSSVNARDDAHSSESYASKARPHQLQCSALGRAKVDLLAPRDWTTLTGGCPGYMQARASTYSTAGHSVQDQPSEKRSLSISQALLCPYIDWVEKYLNSRVY